MNRYSHLHRFTTVLVMVLLSISALPERALGTDETEEAHTLNVANNGVDSPTCGRRDDPCRSISQAITNASAGDLVLVGPGRYGDLNGNGVFGEVGEEAGTPGSCFCMIDVNKRLRFASREGAPATVLDNGGSGVAVVRITASNVVFGIPFKGFTVTGSNLQGGVRIEADKDVWVMGNIAQSNVGADGFSVLRGTGHRLIGNVSSSNGHGFGIFANHTLVRGNIAVDNQNAGFRIDGSGNRLEANRAISNLNGFLMGGPDHLLRRNSAIGNRLSGIAIGAESQFGGPTSRTRIEQTNIYGNNTLINSAFPNCGVQNSSGTIVIAQNNFWGAASGPGVDPADMACNLVATSNTVVKPFAIKEFKLPEFADLDDPNQ
jgi:parallel beta-helix repeat protein